MGKAKVASRFVIVLFIALGSLLFGPPLFRRLAQGLPAAQAQTSARAQTQIERPGTVAVKQGSPAPYIPPACVGKPITTMSRPAMLARIGSEIKPNPPITQTDQLKVFNTLAGVIDEFYLYPDFKGLDWPSIVAEFRRRCRLSS